MDKKACEYCNKQGHVRADCFQEKRDNRATQLEEMRSEAQAGFYDL